MNQQSENTRRKISSILEQVGMTDEELYQLLYGRKQQVEIEIAVPQLLDEDIWLETEHSEEELAHMSQQISVLERLVQTPPQGAALQQLEALLEGELFPDEARGFLLKKHLKNWRQGMMQFLAFLAFSKLQQLAIALATLAAPNLIAQFGQTKNRPQDRRLLADFIIKQVEQPLPPVIGILAESGATLGPTGTLDFKQPLTAVLLQQSPEKIVQMLKILETETDRGTASRTETGETSPAEWSKDVATQQKNKTTALLNKLNVLDRVENLIANQQALQQATADVSQQQDTNTVNPQASRRPKGSRRALREAMERETKENAAQPKPETKTHEHTTSKTESYVQRVLNAQSRPQHSTTPPPRNPAPVIKPEIKPVVSTTQKTTQNPPPAGKSSAPIVPHPDHEHAFKGLFANVPLDALKGITATHISKEELGKTKSSLPKDISPTALKSEPTLER